MASGQWEVGSGEWVVALTLSLNPNLTLSLNPNLTLSQWEVASGEWPVGSGEGPVGRGQRGVASGEWPVGSGEWEATAHYPLPTDELISGKKEAAIIHFSRTGCGNCGRN